MLRNSKCKWIFVAFRFDERSECQRIWEKYSFRNVYREINIFTAWVQLAVLAMSRFLISCDWLFWIHNVSIKGCFQKIFENFVASHKNKLNISKIIYLMMPINAKIFLCSPNFHIPSVMKIQSHLLPFSVAVDSNKKVFQKYILFWRAISICEYVNSHSLCCMHVCSMPNTYHRLVKFSGMSQIDIKNTKSANNNSMRIFKLGTTY